MTTPISAAFQAPGDGCQITFRAALEALSRPGRTQTVMAPAETPAGTSAAAYALLLSLTDHHTPVWLAEPQGPLARALRFHTGCPITADPATASFALLHPGTGPALTDFPVGNDRSPERSATLILDVERLDQGPPRQLRGPGIAATETLCCAAVDERFLSAWRANQARFPAGVDVFLTAERSVVGLPRTTVIDS
jgi:alpha-D-ribose 1-methylphosphonate 5-triphosphate synthase subunit PhnH